MLSNYYFTFLIIHNNLSELLLLTKVLLSKTEINNFIYKNQAAAAAGQLGFIQGFHSVT
jgi:hypothetical protein